MNDRSNPSVRSLLDPVHLVALGFGTGLSPWAPGTFGTLLALPLAWVMTMWPISWRVAVAAIVFVVGIWVAGESAKRLGVHDHRAIVIDEIAAMLTIALVLPRHPAWFAIAFILFRFFDIVKPWPIRDLDHRIRGGVGIMLDDLAAALYAIACLKVVELLQRMT